MRIVFIGCVESSYLLLKVLLENNAQIVGVITKKESKFNSDFADLTPICKEYDIPCYYVSNINDEESKTMIQECDADIAFCFGWSQLLKDEVIDMFPQGVVGYHPAALPNNRGRHPLIWALVLGLEETASTFFMIDKDADTGDIISQVKVPIYREDDARDLMNRVLGVAQTQVVELFENLQTGTTKRIRQEKKAGNSWRKRGKLDGQIDWRMSSEAIYNLVRALTHPYVGAHMMVGDVEVKVWEVKEIITDKYQNIEPGKVLKVNGDRSVEIKAYDNVIKIINYEGPKLTPGNYV